MLRALAKGFRRSDHYGEGTRLSATTICSPVQQTRLLERHDVFVQWDDNIWATYGTIAHGFFEDGAEEHDIVEHKLVIERDGVKIGGTFDLLETNVAHDGKPPHDLYNGRDYKVTSAYGVKAMVKAEEQRPGRGVYLEKPDYFWQAQLYHLFTQDPDVQWVVEVEDEEFGVVRVTQPWPLAGKVKIDNWALTAISRDFNERTHGSVIGPVEVIDIPLLELHRVENFLSQRLALYVASGMADDAGLPECSPAETWSGKRCAKYCAAQPFCHQAGGAHAS